MDKQEITKAILFLESQGEQTLNKLFEKDLLWQNDVSHILWGDSGDYWGIVPDPDTSYWVVDCIPLSFLLEAKQAAMLLRHCLENE